MKTSNNLLHPKAYTQTERFLKCLIRWCLYFVLIFIAFILGASGNYVKPMLLLPIALCIASVSGLCSAGVIGIICGLLLDINSDVTPGFHAILFFLICLGISTLYQKLMKQKFLNMLLFTVLAAGIITGVQFLFLYALWDYKDVIVVYRAELLPCILYTAVSVCIYYPIFSLIHRFFLIPRKQKIEKTVKPIEDE